MKPVLILQHLTGDGPAYLAHWLAARGVPFDVRDTERGHAYPDDLAAFGALAILGGEMSANDELPSLRQAEALFREALREGIPTLGHCLGGQLMARALGARIGESPAPEVGFQEMRVLPEAASRAWFGPIERARVFHWHYEAFELPRGTTALAASRACPNQAFAIGPHVAMQFHIELDAEKAGRWAGEDSERYRQALGCHPASVHDAQRLRSDIPALLPGHQALADRIYGHWLEAASRR